MTRPKPSWVSEIESGLRHVGCTIRVFPATNYWSVNYNVRGESRRLGWKLSVKTAPNGDGYLITRKG